METGAEKAARGVLTIEDLCRSVSSILPGQGHRVGTAERQEGRGFTKRSHTSEADYSTVGLVQVRDQHHKHLQ